MSEIKSSFSCDCCHQNALFFSYNGPYKEKYRCSRHIPSSYKSIRDYPEYREEGKCWVTCSKGITVAMQKHTIDLFIKRNIWKRI